MLHKWYFCSGTVRQIVTLGIALGVLLAIAGRLARAELGVLFVPLSRCPLISPCPIF